ncbi:hypothetical protein FAM09_24740 [Niastella caeni]|uniref:Uncharacterized protein n=1 Tax=Niastella caeni TaxID=2569763 RepID=A0A4S8HIY6_9BACT|nr:hypothetical protein [Niastella caeni]THU34229.1 hypothetical protein FAM09_24740 [Niastella caeni]
MTKKVINWPTNFNNKLACDCMIHIDIAPKAHVSAHVLESTIIEIIIADESYPATKWKLESIYPLKLFQLTSVSSMPSHGMESFEFAKWFLTNNVGANSQTEIAIYYYRKMKE